ncbi:MAG: hypothetical protein AB1704_26490 [Pseudomonadota bacterium]|jgi:hypothetical protein|uniref:hypothetical protein n=1 Tax=Burkholderiaceae TaxID=119060 RepID=UPI0010F77481|nr:hypothetical protein [Burkholderia sp. 4M9327F10]
MDDRGSPVRNANESAHTFPNSSSGHIASKAWSDAAVLAADKPSFRTISGSHEFRVIADTGHQVGDQRGGYTAAHPDEFAPLAALAAHGNAQSPIGLWKTAHPRGVVRAYEEGGGIGGHALR